jgi:hypothetical protein
MQQAERDRGTEEQQEFQGRCRSYGLSKHAITRLLWMYGQYGRGAALVAASIVKDEIRLISLVAQEQGQGYADRGSDAQDAQG